MKYTKEFNVYEFEFWCGAREWVREFQARDMMAELGDYIEDAFYGRAPSEGDINDLVWFDDGLHDLIEQRDATCVDLNDVAEEA